MRGKVFFIYGLPKTGKSKLAREIKSHLEKKKEKVEVISIKTNYRKNNLAFINHKVMEYITLVSSVLSLRKINLIFIAPTIITDLKVEAFDSMVKEEKIIPIHCTANALTLLSRDKDEFYCNILEGFDKRIIPGITCDQKEESSYIPVTFEYDSSEKLPSEIISRIL